MYKVFAKDFLKKLNKKNNIKNKILILGIAFKENTNDLRNSKVFDLSEYLKSKGNNVFVYDPLIKSKLKNTNFKFYNNLKFQGNFDGIFFAVPHKEILNNLLKINKFLKNETIIYDLKSVIPNTFRFKKNVKIISF
jgi:UDP-N-acetyl-D-galactosamine dehydrogenase